MCVCSFLLLFSLRGGGGRQGMLCAMLACVHESMCVCETPVYA